MTATERWRSIETAPKDGTAVLLWFDNPDRHAFAFWRDGQWLDMDDGRGFARSPSQWTPIPGGVGRYDAQILQQLIRHSELMEETTRRLATLNEAMLQFCRAAAETAKALEYLRDQAADEAEDWRDG